MKRHYSNYMFVNNQNQKSAGTEIQNIDTIRGCPLACESCYAKKLSAITIQDFETPIPIEEFTGKVHPDRLYRIGNYGDPCLDWAHSEELVKQYGIFNNFIVTKLVTLKGYTGFFKQLQVSVDTINKTHFELTLQNVWKLKRDFPDVGIVLRIRSIMSRNQELMARQQHAVKFANDLGLPVLETRLRFSKKDSYEKYQLVKEAYEWRGSAVRPKHGLVFVPKAQRYYDCDIYGNKCRDCNNCELPFKQIKKKGKFIADHYNKNKRKYPRKTDAEMRTRLSKEIKSLCG